MINLKPSVVAALQGDAELTALLGGPRVYFQVAPRSQEFPRITYYELDNRGSLYADDGEEASEVILMIDIWHTASTTAIAQAVDRVMTTLGFTRQFAADLYEEDTKVYHKAMRYTAGVKEE